MGILEDNKPFKNQLSYNFKNYFIPFYNVFPHNYRRLIERSFMGTKYNTHEENWGNVTDENIIELSKGKK